MAYFTEAQLRKKHLSFWDVQRQLKTLPQDAKVGIFLSHSHKDKELVKGLIVLLAESGVELYVDWNDDEMPRITSQETAERIKQKIGRLDLFMMLATENALASWWVPWELGVADQLKGYGRIVVVPVTRQSNNNFQGNEYIQVYKRLELGALANGDNGIFSPGRSYQEKSLKVYLREFAQLRRKNVIMKM